MSSGLEELEMTAKAVLDQRKHEIQDGKLHGTHWFVAVCREAEDVLRRRRGWHARTRT